MNANLLALAAIALWGTLAWLGVRLSAMPPFLLVGSALTLAGLIAAPLWRQWRVAPRVLALGIYGLFGFHFFLFVALRLAPPLPANLVNYLWPLMMVLFAPLFLRDASLTRWHVLGGLLGFAGAIVAITNGRLPSWDADQASNPASGAAWGYASALVSAVIWATYSLMGQRLRQRAQTQPLRFPTAAIGLFCLVSGILSLACHAMFEAPYRYAASDAWPLAALAIGPMGAALFLWDAALKRGDARAIGTLAYLTPLISTCLLGLDDPTRFGWPVVVALVLVVGGAALGTLA
ncbi:MAG: DMT family transporter, partial [Burkholderiaceae bacterium]